MIKSYFFLNRQILDVKESIVNKVIAEVFTQEKDKLIIAVRDEDIFYLEFSVNHSLPYYILKDFYFRSRKNSLNFFEQAINKKIIDLFIASDDRVVAFLLDDDSVLYFIVRGKFTNVYYKCNSGFLSFKKVDEADLKNIGTDLINKNFINDFNMPDFSSPIFNENEETIRSRFPFIGKEFFRLAKSISPGSVSDGLKKVLEIIKSNNTIVLINHKNYDIKFSFKGIPRIDEGYEGKEFENVNDALLFFIKEMHQLAQRKEKTQLIQKHIEKELKRLSNKQNNLLAVIQNGNCEEEFKNYGNLLLININKLKTGLEKISLPDIYDNEQVIEIDLDPKLSPKENVERYFNKAKESKVQFEKAKHMLNVISREKQKLIDIQNKLQSAKYLKELEQIAKELKLKMKTQKNVSESMTEKFKHYLVEGKYHVFVGKDSKSNDILTLKFAKQNDYWFHARAVPGSHVVLRVENLKEPVPKSVLKKVASIAAYHSKAKTAGVVPVSYTFKKFVVKRKGMEPGKVALIKEDTLLVSPEIYDGVEFIED
jgi:hypothetical protein